MYSRESFTESPKKPKVTNGAKDNHLDDDDYAYDRLLILLKRYLKSRCS